MEIFIILLIICILITFVYAGVKGAPWVPTKSLDVERFLKLADIKPGDKFYDLGCGDGRIICAAADKGAKSVGFEISIFPYVIAIIRLLFFKKRSKVEIFFKDFWYRNLKDADVVYFFLMPKIYPKLKEKLEKELKKGAKVIAYVWPIEGWEPVKVDAKEGKSKIFLYVR